MASTKPRYSKEEFARRGDEIYEQRIQPVLTEKDKGRLVAIDIETGDYEVGDDEIDVIHRLRARIPGAQAWLVRVGSRYVHRFGLRHARSKYK
jgi:hypothetical protein